LKCWKLKLNFGCCIKSHCLYYVIIMGRLPHLGWFFFQEGTIFSLFGTRKMKGIPCLVMHIIVLLHAIRNFKLIYCQLWKGISTDKVKYKRNSINQIVCTVAQTPFPNCIKADLANESMELDQQHILHTECHLLYTVKQYNSATMINT